MASRKPRRPGVDALAGLVAEILLLLLFVAGAIAFAAFIRAPDARDSTHSDFEWVATCEGGAWGEGDERLTLRHVAGEAVAANDTVISITVDGIVTKYVATALGQGFADGRLAIGEEWTLVANVTEEASLRIQMEVVQPDGGRVLVVDQGTDARSCPTPIP